MIVFDLDGTLADCEHRRHFVDKNKTWCKECHKLMSMEPTIDIQCLKCGGWPTKWKSDWKAFYEACDQDKPIEPTIAIFLNFFDSYDKPVQIWSGRCESVRKKTEDWLMSHGLPIGRSLKMRPIGDYTPDDELKERWLDEYIESMWPKLDKESPDGTEYSRKDSIQFVFDDRPKVVRMWRRRGIFVFDCNQKGNDF